jgi:hypothetical protein
LPLGKRNGAAGGKNMAVNQQIGHGSATYLSLKSLLSLSLKGFYTISWVHPRIILKNLKRQQQKEHYLFNTNLKFEML